VWPKNQLLPLPNVDSIADQELYFWAKLPFAIPNILGFLLGILAVGFFLYQLRHRKDLNYIWGAITLLLSMATLSLLLAMRSVVRDEGILWNWHTFLYPIVFFFAPALNFFILDTLDSNSKWLRFLFLVNCFSTAIAIAFFFTIGGFSRNFLDFGFMKVPIMEKATRFWFVISFLTYLGCFPNFIAHTKKYGMGSLMETRQLAIHSACLCLFSSGPSMMGLPWIPLTIFFLVPVVFLILSLIRKNYKNWEDFFFENHGIFYISGFFTALMLLGFGVATLLYLKPDSSHLNYNHFIILPLISCFVSFIVGAFIAGMNPKSNLNAFASLLFFATGIFDITLAFRTLHLPLLVQWRIDQIADLFLPWSVPIFSKFVYRLMGWKENWVVTISFFLSGIVSLGSLTPFMYSGHFQYEFGIFPKSGPLAQLVGLSALFVVIDAVRQYFKTKPKDPYKKRIFFWLMVYCSFILSNLPSLLGYPIYPLSNLLFLPLGFIGYYFQKGNASSQNRSVSISNRLSLISALILPLIFSIYGFGLASELPWVAKFYHCFMGLTFFLLASYIFVFLLTRPIVQSLESLMLDAQEGRNQAQNESKRADQSAKVLQKLNETVNLINSSNDLHTVSLGLHEFLLKEFQVMHLWVLRVDSKDNTLKSASFIRSKDIWKEEAFDYFSNFSKKIVPSLGLFYKVLERQRPLYLRSLDKLGIALKEVNLLKEPDRHSLFLVPLVAQTQTKGLALLIFPRVGGYHKSVLDKIVLFLYQLTGVLDRTQLMEYSLQDRKDALELAKYLKIMNTIAKEFISSLDLEQIKFQIQNYSKHKFKLPYFGIYILNSEKTQFWLTTAVFPDHLTDEMKTVVSSTPLTLDPDSKIGAHNICFRTRKPVIANSISKFKLTEEESKALSITGADYVINVPLIAKGEVYGILIFQDFYRADRKKIGKSAMLELLDFAQQISGLIYNFLIYRELQGAYAHLQASQEQLVQSEKLAALGQLIAGVAHEINTPLGAIKASIQNLSSGIDFSFAALPQFLRKRTEKESEVLFDLINVAKQSNPMLSTSEERKAKKATAQELEKLGIPEASSKADTLTDMGILSDTQRFEEIFKNPDKTGLMLAYHISGLYKKLVTMQTAIEKVSKIVFALKNYSNFDNTGKMQYASLKEGIETTLTLYQNSFKSGVNLKTNFEDCPDILCFPDEMNQIWTNLIQNSLQAMDYRGEIKVSLRNDPQTQRVQIDFQDSGPGIPASLQAKIFEPFFTTKQLGEGSGLGLHITKRIIEKHGGSIHLESEKGRTLFSILLPYGATAGKETE